MTNLYGTQSGTRGGDDRKPQERTAVGPVHEQPGDTGCPAEAREAKANKNRINFKPLYTLINEKD